MAMVMTDYQHQVEEEEEEVEVGVHPVLLGLAGVFHQLFLLVDEQLAVDLALVLELKVILCVCLEHRLQVAWLALGMVPKKKRFFWDFVPNYG